MHDSPRSTTLTCLALLSICLTTFSSCRSNAASATSRRPPNILLFLVDDMGVADCSLPFLFHFDEYGARGKAIEMANAGRYRTPVLERLARGGMRFTSAHASTVCTPTRVSLMTGLQPARHHVTTWTHPESPRDTGNNEVQRLKSPDWSMAGLEAGQPTLAALLRGVGYRTLHVGKAHFGPNDSFGGDPRHLGFDVNVAGHGAGGPGSYLGRYDFSAAWRGGGRMWDVPGLERYHGDDVFLTEALTREMGKAIDEALRSKQPFFAYMAHYAVHAPFEVDERFAGNYPELHGASKQKELAFATMVEGMDRSLGDLLALLEARGVAEETLVVFYSDNGSDGPANLPLRGKKGTRFEGGCRVPLVIAWAKPDPQHPMQRAISIEPNSLEDDMVGAEDVFATLASIAGAKFAHQVDGHDLSPYLRGTPGVHRPQERLVHFPHGHNDDHFTTYRQGAFKLIYQYGPRRWELYDLEHDLGEATNLLSSAPSRALQLARTMRQRLEDCGAQMPVQVATGAAEWPDTTALEALLRPTETRPRAR